MRILGTISMFVKSIILFKNKPMVGLSFKAKTVVILFYLVYKKMDFERQIS